MVLRILLNPVFCDGISGSFVFFLISTGGIMSLTRFRHFKHLEHLNSPPPVGSTIYKRQLRIEDIEPTVETVVLSDRKISHVAETVVQQASDINSITAQIAAQQAMTKATSPVLLPERKIVSNLESFANSMQTSNNKGSNSTGDESFALNEALNILKNSTGSVEDIYRIHELLNPNFDSAIYDKFFGACVTSVGGVVSLVETFTVGDVNLYAIFGAIFYKKFLITSFNFLFGFPRQMPTTLLNKYEQIVIHLLSRMQNSNPEIKNFVYTISPVLYDLFKRRAVNANQTPHMDTYFQTIKKLIYKFVQQKQQQQHQKKNAKK